MEFEKQNKYLEYIRTNFNIATKNLFEYKLNAIFLCIEHTIYFLAIVLLFKVVYNNFSDVINWSLEDYVLLYIIFDLIAATSGVFVLRNERLNMSIRSGNFNIFLLRPLPPFFSYFFANMKNKAFFWIIFNPIIHFSFYFYFFDWNIPIFNTLLAIPFILLIWILYVAFREFCYSLELIKKGLSWFFIHNLGTFTNTFTRQYPYQFFDSIKYRAILLLISPLFFISSLVIPILKNYPIWNLKLQIFIVLTSIIIFTIGTYINWYFGLKKYEAYG